MQKSQIKNQFQKSLKLLNAKYATIIFIYIWKLMAGCWRSWSPEDESFATVRPQFPAVHKKYQNLIHRFEFSDLIHPPQRIDQSYSGFFPCFFWSNVSLAHLWTMCRNVCSDTESFLCYITVLNKSLSYFCSGKSQKSLYLPTYLPTYCGNEQLNISAYPLFCFCLYWDTTQFLWQ